MKDYRPISILPVLSKVYEKVILNRLSKYIKDQIIYNSTQSGFIKGHSTTTLLLKLRDDIKRAMRNNEITLSVLIDDSKAFDTIDHEILLKKLISMNFSRGAIKILMSYLSNRQQYVQVDCHCSMHLPIYFGVPQGSILGPVIFNLYVAELPNYITSDSIQYVDDTTLYRSCKLNRIESNIKVLECDLAALSTWSSENGLVFNNDKLKYMFLSAKSNEKHKITNYKSYLIRSNSKSIQQEKNVKLLGVTFDQHMTWNEHVNNVIKATYGNTARSEIFQESYTI